MEEQEQDPAPPAADDEADDEYMVSGNEAVAQWRKMRYMVLAGVAGYIGGLVIAGLFWHRSPGQLFWVALGLAVVFRAILVWTHGLEGFAYNTARGSEPLFVGRLPVVRREIETPVLLLAAVLLFLSATSTGFGRTLASIFEVIKTLYDAEQNAEGLVGAALAVILMLIFAVVSLTISGLGIFYLIRFIVRGFRSLTDAGSGLAVMLAGAVMLAVTAFFAYALYRYHNQVLDAALAPYRTIWGWLR